MKPFDLQRAACFHKVVLLALVLAGSVRAETSTDRLRIDRWTRAGEPAKIDDSIVQRLGEKIGAGHFLVANDMLGQEETASTTTARLFSFYSMSSPGRDQSLKGAVLFLPDERGGIFETGSTERLIAMFLSYPSVSKESDAAISSGVSVILSSVLFAGKGRWLNREDGSTFEFSLTRGSGSLNWKGTYLREAGDIEEVTVAFSSVAANEVKISRRELAPARFIASGGRNDFLLEEWTIDPVSRWHPSHRYKMMTTMAALGNPTKQFQLATALLQEPEEGARTEGMKWLRTAAAQGYRDAIDLLQQGGDELVRSDRDRDKVRVSRCCPVPGR